MIATSYLIGALDIGSTKTCAVLGELVMDSEGTPQVKVLGVGQVRPNGIRRDAVSNLEETTEEIRQALKQAELMAGVQPRGLYVGISAEYVQTSMSNGDVANGEEEIKQPEGIIAKARECGARDLTLIDADRVQELEPQVKADAAILSPTTGIMDAHGLMNHYHREARRKSGGDPLVLDTEVTSIKQKGDGYLVEMLSGGESFSVEARMVINSAGLYADRVAEMTGIDVDEAGYRIHWCKGDYFSLTGKPPAKMLVYPPPPLDAASLGIHTVPDLTGRLKFGPSAYYVDEITYNVEGSRDEFWEDIVKYIPDIKKEDLHPDMSGIRAKLQAPGDPVRDFVIKHEEDRGYPGLINLIGIESPGLTSSPAIANIVSAMVEEYL